MKASDYIEDRVNKLPKGYVFTYVDFLSEVAKREAIIKHLNRMVVSGKIEKLSKGKYYKPQSTVFGNLLPEQNQIVKDLLEKNGKLLGYITGYSFYNAMGFTAQVSSIIQIAKNETRPSLQRGRFKIAFIKQKNTITKQNIPLLRLLDAIRFIKDIPDATINNSCTRLLTLLADLSEEEQEQIKKLALKYPPSTRALLGAFFQQIDSNQNTETLKKSLNPITTYNLSVSENILPTAKNWNIK
ncbi:DUF6088 family protein [Lutibacter sp. A64]|uniref:DUF6088 family protein n=1 Tax=Lutibacter sp. A64 TaxID=2918526 RepID=UPI001F070E5B|nr:DUF6088 family protein [Lutibacter sp. A64]UMB53724.1 DUF6088 family protein [Lutibacter sp. A64]